MPETIRIVGDNLTFDLLLWRRYGLKGQALVEETAGLNPEQTGLHLIPGSMVVLPDAPPASAPQQSVVTLFGRR